MELYPITIPGGPDTGVQYNKGGVFGADATFTFNDTTKVVTMAGATIPGCAVFGLNSVVFQPAASGDSTAFLRIKNAAGAIVGNFDTTNKRVGIDRIVSLSSSILHLQAVGGHVYFGDPTDHNVRISDSDLAMDMRFAASSRLIFSSNAQGCFGSSFAPANGYGGFRFGNGTDFVYITAGLNGDLLLNPAAGNVGVNELNPETLTEWTHTSPYITLHNSTHEDTDGGGESRLIFKREDGAGTETACFQFEASHDGAGVNDQFGKGIWSVNTGAGLVQALEIGSDLRATFSGAIASGTLTITASSDTTDVSGINTLFVNTTTGDVTLGGLVGGVDGQPLFIIKIVAVNDLILEHEEGIGGDTDDFFMHQLGDEIIDAGGVPVVYNGTTEKWYDISHAKHV